MTKPLNAPTSTSLIIRAKSLDADAWERLVKLYSPLVLHWTQVARLQEADAADVMQEVFEALAHSLSKFQLGPNQPPFRGWLYGITRNKIKMHFRSKAKNANAVGGTEAHQKYVELPEIESEPDDDSAMNVNNSIARRALELIKTDFQETTWKAFWKVTVEERAAADVAKELGISPGAVYTAKSRVLKQLRIELDGLL